MKKDYGLKVKGHRSWITVFLLLNLLNPLNPLNSVAFGQQYNGMTGLIHTPSAEMNAAGDVRIGAHIICPEQVPNSMDHAKIDYSPYTYYLNITPFSWVELAYVCFATKDVEGKFAEAGKWAFKDRHFALKLRPLKEGKWYPAIALGADDFLTDNLGDNNEGTNAQFFTDYWIVATKHFRLSGHELAVNAGYRYYKMEANKKYQGINAALTYRPALSEKVSRFVQPRIITEYDGYGFNFGLDAMLFRHALLQVSCIHLKGVSAGLAFQLNLLGKKTTP